jgi:hypothetical protein
LVRTAGALAETGQHYQAERVARSITDPVQQAEALTQVVEALVKAGDNRSASRLAAAICTVGRWTTAARSVLLLKNPSEFTMLASATEERSK